MYVTVKANNTRSKLVINKAKNWWLKKEMNYLYSKLHKVEFELYVLHLKLTKNLTAIEFECFKEFEAKLFRVVEHKVGIKSKKLNEKLKKLIEVNMNIQIRRQPDEGSTNTQQEFNTALVKNLSTVAHTESEIKILEKGLNFAFKPPKPPIEEIVADVEIGIWDLPEESKESIRSDVHRIITNNIKETDFRPNKLLQITKQLKNKNCYYVKADKGNTIVILNKDDYINRVNKLISEGLYEKLNKNPLTKMENDVDKVLKKFEAFQDDPQWRLKLKVPNARIPRLYALPKIHKPGEQMRPISSNINSPSSKISKWLVSEFSKLSKVNGRYVKNSFEFVEQVKDLELLDDEILVSFDVQALFPSVPIEDTMLFLREWLTQQHINPLKIELYVELTEICMKQNVFTFNGEWFKQTEGTAMGNSLSPFIANLFMCFFENNLSNNPDFPRIWIRYVDDVFAVLKADKIQDTLSLLNSQYQTINFTCETESQGKLPFLDLLIIKNNRMIEFDIFRKATHTPLFILNESFHPEKQKYAAINSMVHRMYAIPLNDERRKNEKQYILKLGEFNQLNKDVILRIINKKELEHVRNQNTTLLKIKEENMKKYIKMTYYPKLTNKLINIFNKHNLGLAFSSPLKLKTLLESTKDKITKMDKSGVYKINCNGCRASYIGMTKRKLKQRLKDHVSDYRNEHEKTAIAKHFKEENSALGRGRRKQKKHCLDEENMDLLKEVENYKKLCVWESIFINKYRSTAVNDNNGTVDSILTRIFLDGSH